MKKLALTLILIILIPGACRAKNFPKICFKENCVSLEIADTDISRSRGLMFRAALPEKSGMLFVFPEEGIYGFWMKNTKIPLDMIWLDKDFKVVEIKSFVPVCVSDDCPVYDPKVAAKYVLEVNAGFSGLYQIKTGDKANFKNE
jgi:uncharacterized protein